MLSLSMCYASDLVIQDQEMCLCVIIEYDKNVLKKALWNRNLSEITNFNRSCVCSRDV
jgi:hypothetical protein